jgi:hypothetical protein
MDVQACWEPCVRCPANPAEHLTSVSVRLLIGISSLIYAHSLSSNPCILLANGCSRVLNICVTAGTCNGCSSRVLLTALHYSLGWWMLQLGLQALT